MTKFVDSLFIITIVDEVLSLVRCWVQMPVKRFSYTEIRFDIYVYGEINCK